MGLRSAGCPESASHPWSSSYQGLARGERAARPRADARRPLAGVTPRPGPPGRVDPRHRCLGGQCSPDGAPYLATVRAPEDLDATRQRMGGRHFAPPGHHPGRHLHWRRGRRRQLTLRSIPHPRHAARRGQVRGYLPARFAADQEQHPDRADATAFEVNRDGAARRGAAEGFRSGVDDDPDGAVDPRTPPRVGRVREA